MKLNKILMMAAVAMTGLFAACDDDYEYAPGDPCTTDGVYFTDPSNTDISLSKSESSYTIQLGRQNTTEAKTYNLVVTNPTDKLSIPSQISFAAGAATADLVITYIPDSLVYDEMFDVTIQVPEDASSPYRDDIYAFTIGVPAPWESLGIGTFMTTKDEWWGEEWAVKVEIFHNTVDTRQYRIKEPFKAILGDYYNGNGGDLVFYVLPAGSQLGNITTTQDGLVYFDQFNYGYYYSSYDADIYCIHPADFTKYASDESYLVYNYVSQFAEDGSPEIITLSPYYYMFGVGGWNYTDAECIKIVMPGVVVGDYSSSISYAGRYTDADDASTAKINLELGADVAYAKVAVVEGLATSDTFAGIKDGSIESTEYSSSTTVDYACDKSGYYSVAVVTYSDDDKARETNSYEFFYVAGNDSWNSLGMATVTDGIVGALFGAQFIDYQVEIQELSTMPGMFRLVNLYGEAYPYNEEGDWPSVSRSRDTSKNYYTLIDATDAEGGVVIETPQPTGLQWAAQGADAPYDIQLWCDGAYYMNNGYSREDLKSWGYFGTYADGVISMDGIAGALIDDSYYDAYADNAYCSLFVTLPGTDAQAARARQNAVQYHLNGHKLTAQKQFHHPAPVKL